MKSAFICLCLSIFASTPSFCREVNCSFGTVEEANEMKNCSDDTLKEALIVPKYVRYGSHGVLHVEYDCSSFCNFTQKANCGNELSGICTLNAPLVKYEGPKNCGNMSILLWDPDHAILNAPIVKPSYLQWFAANIPYDDLKKGYNGQEDDVFEYEKLFSPTGNHRYTACAYCQMTFIDAAEVKSKTGEVRSGLNMTAFADDNGLRPEACNYFLLGVLGGFGLDHFANLTGINILVQLNRDFGNKDKRWYDSLSGLVQ